MNLDHSNYLIGKSGKTNRTWEFEPNMTQIFVYGFVLIWYGLHSGQPAWPKKISGHV